MRNAIPFEAEVVLTLPKENVEALNDMIADFLIFYHTANDQSNYTNYNCSNNYCSHNYLAFPERTYLFHFLLARCDLKSLALFIRSEQQIDKCDNNYDCYYCSNTKAGTCKETTDLIDY